MKAIILYSGGKDSSLVTWMLKKMGYEPLLVTANFGVVPDAVKTAKDAAEALGYKNETLTLPTEAIEKATDRVEKDGLPANGIDEAHHYVLEEAAKKYSKDFALIADGCRRDDKTPKVTVPEACSLEDRQGIEYFGALSSVSFRTIKYLTDNIFILESIQAGRIPTSEYETEIRATLKNRGVDPTTLFPENHYHTIVKGWKDRAHSPSN